MTTDTSQCVVNALYRASIGIDVHLDLLVCAYQVCDLEAKQIRTETAEFRTNGKALKQFGRWCAERHPEIILMESTGVLWRSPYETLENFGFTADQLALVNARDVKAVYGRKTDEQDAARLAQIARIGNFKKSFVPPKVFRDMRVISRNYRTCVNDYSRHKNRYQKDLNSTGCRASTVFSNVNGMAAQNILRAYILDGSDLETVIQNNCRRLKATPEEIFDALKVELSPVMLLVLRDDLDHLTYLEDRRDRLLEMLRETQRPYEELIRRLCTIPGIKEITARLLLAELTDSLDAFPSAEHLASWIGVCPGNNESAGKKHGCGTPKGNKYARQVLVEAANGIALMRNGALHDRFEAYRLRRGRKRAIVAIAHLLVRIIYAMYKNASDYCETPDLTLRDVCLRRMSTATRLAKEHNVIVDIERNEMVDLETGEIRPIPNGVFLNVG